MADIRINGRRIPALQAIDNGLLLVKRLEAIGQRNSTALTGLSINGRVFEIENSELSRLKFENDDTVEARMETREQLSFESLQVAQEMAELLVFDLKVATLKMWDNNRYFEKSLETLLSDCNLFLTLGARPIELLECNLLQISTSGEACLRQLDAVANHIEDATLLAVNGEHRDACHVLVARVQPSIEKWLGLTAAFAQELEIDKVQVPTIITEGVPGLATPHAGQLKSVAD